MINVLSILAIIYVCNKLFRISDSYEVDIKKFDLEIKELEDEIECLKEELDHLKEENKVLRENKGRIPREDTDAT